MPPMPRQMSRRGAAWLISYLRSVTPVTRRAFSSKLLSIATGVRMLHSSAEPLKYASPYE